MEMQRKTIGEPEEHLWKIHGTPEGNVKETKGKTNVESQGNSKNNSRNP